METFERIQTRAGSPTECYLCLTAISEGEPIARVLLDDRPAWQVCHYCDRDAIVGTVIYWRDGQPIRRGDGVRWAQTVSRDLGPALQDLSAGVVVRDLLFRATTPRTSRKERGSGGMTEQSNLTAQPTLASLQTATASLLRAAASILRLHNPHDLAAHAVAISLEACATQAEPAPTAPPLDRTRVDGLCLVLRGHLGSIELELGESGFAGNLAAVDVASTRIHMARVTLAILRAVAHHPPADELAKSIDAEVLA